MFLFKGASKFSDVCLPGVIFQGMKNFRIEALQTSPRREEQLPGSLLDKAITSLKPYVSNRYTFDGQFCGPGSFGCGKLLRIQPGAKRNVSILF